ncbi:MAG: uroporphyrinogen-III synthase [Acidobacteria bacterium]|nr:uroporphyrinogen-III synthase [Acidobacteriota bacterium]
MTAKAEGPLAGTRVVVTRAEHQAEELLEAYRRQGADAVPLPLIEVVAPADPEPLADAARSVAELAWVAFTSANAVDAFVPLVDGWPRRLRIAAEGRATADALESRGLAADLVPARADAEGLAAELGRHLAAGETVLLPQAADARPLLARRLTEAGFEPRVVVAYDKRLPADAPARAAELFDHDPLGWVTITSPRIAGAFAALFGEDWPRRRGELRAVSVGAVTSAELRRWGVEPAAEALSPTRDGLVAATVAALFGGVGCG